MILSWGNVGIDYWGDVIEIGGNMRSETMYYPGILKVRQSCKNENCKNNLKYLEDVKYTILNLKQICENLVKIKSDMKVKINIIFRNWKMSKRRWVLGGEYWREIRSEESEKDVLD